MHPGWNYLELKYTGYLILLLYFKTTENYICIDYELG
jgi:hypothetical protein